MSRKSMRRRWLRSSALAGAAWLALAAGAAAAEDAAYAFDIPPESLSKALRDYGRATNRQLIFTEDLVRAQRSSGLKGRYSADAAIDRLLDGTNLAWRLAPSGGMMIVRREAASPQVSAAASNADEIVKLSEVVVTGSRLTPSKDDISPLNTYSAAAIAQSGQTSLTGFLNTLPEVSVGSSGNGFGVGGQTTVRLRGLPTGATLVLLDGRRISASGVGGASAFVDLNAIPSDLVARVDIVPVGSSAVYGSDAIGGVVNIILKTRFNGIGGSISQSFADSYDDRRASLGLGHVFSRGSISLVASYRDQGNLRGADRALTANSDFRRFAALGGVDRRQQYCEPGTVTAASGLLAGVGAATAGIPTTGASPKFVPANFTATAGVPNLCSYYAVENMIPAVKGPSGVLSGDLALTDDITLYGQLFYSEYDTDNRQPGQPASRLAVPASNAFNPFGQAVTVSTVFPVMSGYREKSKVSRPLVGLRGHLGGGWSWDLAAWTSITQDRVLGIVQDNTALTAALASADPTTALDPFRPSSNSAALLTRIFPTPRNAYRTERQGADAVLRGDLLQLPAGPLAVAVGWESGRETVKRTLFVATGSAGTSGDRDTQSVFAEARAPLLRGTDDDTPLLQLDLAGRYDHYSDFGGKTTPQAALEYRPFKRLSFRAAYSEAFKAPTLLQLFSGQTSSTPPLLDPKLGTSITPTAITGGNRDLKPEAGKSDSLTIAWNDPAWHNLRIAATYFTIQEDSRIVQAAPQTVLNNEDIFVGRVTRATPAAGATLGRVVSVDATYLNYGGLKVSGVDLSASLDLPLRGGVLTPRIAVTRMLKYSSQIGPGTPFVDRLSQASMTDVWAPRYKATIGASWTGQALSLSLQSRFVGRYLDYQTPANTNQLGGDWTVDASAQLDLDALPLMTRAPAGFYVRVAVSNLLDRGPRFSNYNSDFIGFDPTVDDILGRTVTLTLGRHF